MSQAETGQKVMIASGSRRSLRGLQSPCFGFFFSDSAKGVQWIGSGSSTCQKKLEWVMKAAILSTKCLVKQWGSMFKLIPTIPSCGQVEIWKWRIWSNKKPKNQVFKLRNIRKFAMVSQRTKTPTLQTYQHLISQRTKKPNVQT